ncbi:uncharacterized protein LODBEIA_P32200 [Lodderomyces beijingensis]|uniref:WKF domain-containing protein n=1 Tax=Lodderomyces beijingensis TaxID=1775926 RepID=A0ABP0ZLG9_9ASCO
MSSIPAWKRAGLSVQAQEADEDDLLTTKRIETADLTTKQIKKASNKRKLQDDVTHGKKDKKAPKRIKVPKNERKPPPEKDQLVYLRQFQDDKPNWKFNKSKQNWILKNIRDIPESYSSALKLYLASLQGGSRDRLVEELKSAVEKWNVQYEEMERKIEAKLAAGENSAEQATTTEEAKGALGKDAMSLDTALRFRDILSALVEEKIIIKGQDEGGEAGDGLSKEEPSATEEEIIEKVKEEQHEEDICIENEKKPKKEKSKKDKLEAKPKKRSKKDKSEEKKSNDADGYCSNLIVSEIDVS